MSKVNDIISKQITLHTKINDYFKNFLRNYPENTLRSGDVDARIITLKTTWDKYQTNDQILQECKDETNDKEEYYTNTSYSLEEVEEEFTVTYGNFLSLKNRLLTKENNVTGNRQQAPQVVTQNNSTLPKIPLPTFDGDQLQWESFKEVFQARVADDDTIIPVFKLQHLLSHIKGEAARRLAGMELTEANFEVAWNRLKRRYDNKKLRLSTHLSRIISIPAISGRANNGINQLMDTVEASIRALKALDRPVDHWDDWFVHLIVSKLDPNTRTDWEKSRENEDAFSTYEQLTTFLENRARTLNSSLTLNHQASSSSKVQGANNPKRSHVSTHATSAGSTRESPECKFCPGESHSLSKCSRFLQMTVPQRRSSVPSSCCYNCLATGHRVDKCNSKWSCKTCGSRHHTMLHIDKVTANATNVTAPDDDNSCQTMPSNVTVCTTSVGGRVLMATALIKLRSESNELIVRALLDPASDECFVTEHVAQALRLKRNPVSTSVRGVGGSTATPPNSLVSLVINSLKHANFTMNIYALVLRKLTDLLPNVQVQNQEWSHIKGLDFADPEYYKPGRIDCILGAEAYAIAIREGLCQGAYPSPIAQNTVFGWVLTGPFKALTRPGDQVTCHVTQAEDSINQQLHKFWEIEELPQKTHLTSEEERCESHFQQTHCRDADGRFILRLPFKQVPVLPGIYEIAKARFLSCERRLHANPQLLSSYTKFMQEYLDLQHMELVPQNELQRDNVSYIPHHGVLKADGSGKIRVVFNASQRARNGKSLNDHLHVGPKLQSELFGVLTRWRFFQYAFTADIVKMFRQFIIHPEDRDWLRILWRPSTDQPIQTYRLRTVTYGTGPAPYQAIRCLKQLATDQADQFPLGAAILRNNSYVDDNLGGGHTLETAIQARDELIGILATAGMKLDKWSANHPQIISEESTSSNQDHSFEETISTLGLIWNPRSDCFQFKVKKTLNSLVLTKRTILSEIASLFDPLGWLAPVIITAKVYIQELWIRQSGWDQPVDADLRDAWLNFKSQLPDIEHIQIPRWIHTTNTPTWELHGFADASERAYAAAVFLVVYSDSEVCQTSLLSAKTKVAPVKKLSIPRLELCGTQLLARLIHSTIKQLPQKPSKIHCWSDSQTTLAWLRGHPTKWHTFVANRVSEIHSLIDGAVWGHVPSAQNPADLATRGASPSQLNDAAIWWTGPDWLRQGPKFWPKIQSQSLSTDCELKTSTRIFKTSVEDTRLLDWMSRWKVKAKTKQEAIPVDTRAAAKVAIIRVFQRHFFYEELHSLRAGKPLNKSSCLRSLVPFLSTDGILRVGGRLQNAPISEYEKHPAIIPKKSHLSSLLIRDAHQRTLHGGSLLVQSMLRQEYWIIHDRSQIRQAIKTCPRCLRFQGSCQRQIMAPLPKVRLQPSRPFTYTGVDYAGPFNTRASKGRGHTSSKSYVAVFVCMVTRAVHLELVSDYSSKAFIAAYRRFSSRRGLTEIMYSDHGTTFQGAVTEIRKLFKEHSNFMKEVSALLETDGVKWTFIPPKGPHFGGLWESKVKAFKHHLNRVAANSTLTFEEFTTLLTQIEACLNSRPLSPLTSDSSDLNALTPGHFLIGGPILLLPGNYSATESPRNPVERWHMIQKMLGDFWRRWRNEVLHDLQQRSKWLEPQRNLQIDDIVIIRDELSPPGRWQLGRVISRHPGPDGQVRSVTLKTASTTLVRPIVKLILLPTDPTNDDNLSAIKVN